MGEKPEEVTLRFNASRLGVKIADRGFDPQSTIGEAHARVRKLVGSAAVTYLFISNGTECFIPSPSQTIGELFDVYGVDGRVLPLTIDLEIFSG